MGLVVQFLVTVWRSAGEIGRFEIQLPVVGGQEVFLVRKARSRLFRFEQGSHHQVGAVFTDVRIDEEGPFCGTGLR